MLDRMARRGREYEARFLETLRADGLQIEEIRPPDTVSPSRAVESEHAVTLRAMRDGADVIYQAVLLGDRRLGYADFLRRVETPSDLGSWSYEVWDTKLARKPTAPAVLQISMYSDLLGVMQGRPPERMHLVLGGVARSTESLRVADFAAYYRLVARQFETLLDDSESAFPISTKPEPMDHCDFCSWNQACRAQWRREDDLALVANLTSRQRRALHTVGVTTRRGLADPSPPLPERLDGVSPESLERAQAQAAIQVRGEGRVISERIPPERDREHTLVPDRGLWALPEPSPGDLFLDLEGDPFYGSEEIDGVDYLFGVIEPGRPDHAGDPTFHAFWSIADGTVTPAAERQAFEDCMDLIMDRWADHPGMHVYHYAPYETGAMKRLAGRYATRESELDQLLRGGVFVDLYRVVRQGIRASVESYSIKRLEPLYGFTREIDLRDAGESIVEFEHWLEPEEGTDRDELLERIRAYNRDDCLSTWRLREWLEEQRAALVREVGAEAPPRPMVMPVEGTEDSEVQQAVRELAAELTADLPPDLTDGRSLDDPAQRGRWLLAQLLDWHRREDKAFWWRYFHLRDELTDEDRVNESDALGRLAFVGSEADPRPRSRSTLHSYRFPPQDHKIDVGDKPHDQHGAPVGEVVAVDDRAGLVQLRVGSSRGAPALTSLIPHEHVRPGPKPPSLWNLAAWVIELGIDAAGPYRAARDLLLRRPPRLGQAEGAPLAHDGEDAQDAARRLIHSLDESYLAIQGPPGSGKSTVGAEMIVDLVEAREARGGDGQQPQGRRRTAGKDGAGGRGARRCGQDRPADQLQVRRAGIRRRCAPAPRRGRVPPARDGLAGRGGRHHLALGARGSRGPGGRALHRRGRADVAGRRAGRRALRRQPVAAGRSAAVGSAAAGRASARRGPFGAGARAGRRAGHAERHGPFPGRHVAPASQHLRLHLGSVLRGLPAPTRRPREPGPGRFFPVRRHGVALRGGGA